MSPQLIITIILLISGCIFLHATKQLLSLWLKIALVFLLLLSGYVYSGYGKLHTMYPRDTAYQNKFHKAPKQTVLHWHELFHYYLGAKYFRELGYKGLYETVAYADSISPKPDMRAVGLRSLRDPTHHITREEGLRRGREEFRPNFTDSRWKSFTTDIENMKAIASEKWLDLGLFDAGYNPPPTWAVIGTTIANLAPLSQEEAWGGDKRPDWYQIEWLPFFDILMLACAMCTVAWAFGGLGAIAFGIMFFLNETSSMGWIGGGFFRYTWLAELMIGLSFLKKQRYIPAGIFLALSTADRIFPAVFLCAAGFAMLAESTRTKHYRTFLQFVISAICTLAIMFSLSVLMFGIEAWQAFFEKILTHKDLYFVNHIGYRRVAVFGPEVPNQNFWWEPGLDSFRNWNAALNTKWQQIRNLHYVLWAAMLAAAAYASSRAHPEEAALMLGGLIFFLLEIPANYYYIYFPMVFVVMLTSPNTRLRPVLLCAFITLWLTLHYDNTLSRDDLVRNYYKCCAFLAFFCFWVFSRTGETLLWVLREQQAKAQQLMKTP